MPPKKPGDTGDGGEGEDGEGEGEDNNDEESTVKLGTASGQNLFWMGSASTRKATCDTEELYSELEKTEQVDVIAGVEPNLYADIRQSTHAQRLLVRAQMNCSEYAIVATWDLESETDKFVC